MACLSVLVPICAGTMAAAPRLPFVSA
jgi:hypothetical protein